jgi:hypothetical protein
MVYKILIAHGVPVPVHVVVRREPGPAGEPPSELIEHDDYIEVWVIT